MGFVADCGRSDLPSEDRHGRFDARALAAELPGDALTVIVDHYLTRRESASSRLVRTLRPVPAHYHRTCDEYVFILDGAGVVWLGDAARRMQFRPGHLLFFARGVPHCMPRIDGHPVLSLSVDAPSRPEDDVVYVDRDGLPTTEDGASAWSTEG